MHKFWDIPELVNSLLEHLDRQSHARVAQLNTDFWLQTIGRLWTIIPNADPLLRLVVRWETAYAFFTHAEPDTMPPVSAPYVIQDGDLDRFDIYSPLVTEIEESPDERTLKFLLEIKRYKCYPYLLPNLVHVRYAMPHNRSPWNEISIILPPDLRSLSVSFVPFAFKDRMTFDEAVIPATSFPCLTTLSITTSRQFAKHSRVWDALLRFIRRHVETLVSVTLCAYGQVADATPTLAALAAAPRLRELAIKSGWAGDGLIPIPSGFASLSTLEVQFPHTNVFATIETTQLQRLTLHSKAKALEKAEPDLRRFRDLKVVKLQLTPDDTVIEPFRCFLHCRHLTTFDLHLSFSQSMVLDNSHVETMTQAWPQLRILRIRTRGDWDHKVTFKGLLCLASRCPDLEVLHITVDAREMGDTPVGHSGVKVKDLSLGWTIVDEKALPAVAAFIGDMWPFRKSSRVLWEDERWMSGHGHYWKGIWAAADERSREWRDRHSMSTAGAFMTNLRL